MRDGQQPDSAFPFDTGQPHLLQRYIVANDPTVGKDFATPRTMRVCNILSYMPQVVVDHNHLDADEAKIASSAGESVIQPVCAATRTHPVQLDSDSLPASTETARTVRHNAQGMPTVNVTGTTPSGTSAITVPATRWATETDLLQASVPRLQCGSAKTHQGRSREYETVDCILNEEGGGGLGQQETTSNSGAPPPFELTVKIMLPDGSSEMVCAMLDTGSRECNLTSYERAMRWRAAKAKGSFNGKPGSDTLLQSYSGVTEPSYGTLHLRCEVSPQHVPIPANLQFDFECEVAQVLPDGIDLIIGRPTLHSTGLLRSVVLAESQTPDSFAQTLREATLEEEAEFWEVPELGEFTMPKIYGTPEQKHQLRRRRCSESRT